MKGKMLFLMMGMCLFLCISNLHAMECRVVDVEGNTIYSANAGDLVFFESIYAYSKSKKLSWNLMVTLPTIDKKFFKTSMKYNGYFYHVGSFEDRFHFIPIVIPADSFIEGDATFKYTLTGNRACYVYLNILQQDTIAPSIPTLTATAISSSQINLSWTASNDNVGVSGYNVYSGNGTYLRSVTGTSTSFIGLNANTQYCHKMTAYDAALNESGFSNTACATTNAPPIVPQTGTWNGSVVSFNVSSTSTSLTSTGSSLIRPADGKPKTLRLDVTGIKCTAMTIWYDGTISINNNSFSQSGTFSDGSHFSVSGKFDSATRASGTYSYSGVGTECSGSGNWVTYK